MARVLVGIPCFKVADQVRRCLESLVETPADVMAIDNAADEDVKLLLNTFEGRIKVAHSPTNEFCNGAWNRVLEYGIEQNYEVISLGSSDAVLHPGWYEGMCSRLVEFPKEILVPKIREPLQTPDYRKVTYSEGGLAGYFMFMTREAAKLVFPIPRDLFHWYGDSHIFNVLKESGYKVAVTEELGAYHEQGSNRLVNLHETDAAILHDKRIWYKDPQYTEVIEIVPRRFKRKS